MKFFKKDFETIENKAKEIIFSYKNQCNTRIVRKELIDRLFQLFASYGLEDELRITVPSYEYDANTITLIALNSFSEYFLSHIFENNEHYITTNYMEEGGE